MTGNTIPNQSNTRPILRAFLYSLLLFAVLIALGGVMYCLQIQLVWGGYFACSFFYAVMFLIGFVAVPSTDASSSKEFLLTGRRLPLGIALMSMTATWVGGGFINGSAEAAYQSGLAWTQAPWGYALSLVIGGLFFAGPMRRHGYTTMLDPLEDRYGTKMAALLYVPALMGEIFWTAAILTALGTTFGFILGIDFNLSIILSAFVAVVYTSVGGLRSVAMTDVFQLIILILGLYLALLFVVPESGILSVWERYRSVHGELAYPWPTRAWGIEAFLWWDYAFLLIFGGIPWHVYFQRVLSSESESTAKWLSISAGGMCLVAAFPAVLIGMIGATTDWSEIGSTAPTNSALILPFVLQRLAPPFVSTIALGAVAAAVMSSVDSSILSAASMGSWNVYRPLFRKENSPDAIKLVVRRLIWIIGIAATLLALRIQSVYTLWFLCSDLVYCILFPQLVTALFDRRANRIGSICGLVVSALLRLGGGERALGLPTWIPYPMVDDAGVINFPFRTTSMLGGLVVIFAVSRMTTKFAHPTGLRIRGNQEATKEHV